MWVQCLAWHLACNQHSFSKPLSPASFGRFHSPRTGSTNTNLWPLPEHCMEKAFATWTWHLFQEWSFPRHLPSLSPSPKPSLLTSFGIWLFWLRGLFHLASPLFGMIIHDFVLVPFAKSFHHKQFWKYILMYPDWPSSLPGSGSHRRWALSTVQLGLWMRLLCPFSSGNTRPTVGKLPKSRNLGEQDKVLCSAWKRNSTPSKLPGKLIRNSSKSSL